jgi:uncharacterized damage-inducible protein DinB
MKELLLNYARFNLWANQRVCDFLLGAEEEKLHHEINSSFSSILKTCAHVLGAESIWVMRLHGTSPAAPPAKYEEMPMIEIATRWQNKSQEMINYIENKTETELMQMLSYKNLAGQSFTNAVRDIMQHVFNHGTYHRGQIVTMLRQVGYTRLFPTDYIAFCREQQHEQTKTSLQG